MKIIIEILIFLTLVFAVFVGTFTTFQSILIFLLFFANMTLIDIFSQLNKKRDN